MSALTTTRRRLTAADVIRTIQEDERHGGWGLATCEDLPLREANRLLRIVAEVANEFGADYEDLFLFSNSRPARHMVDEFHGPRKAAAEFRERVRAYLNPEMIAHLRAEQ